MVIKLRKKQATDSGSRTPADPVSDNVVNLTKQFSNNLMIMRTYADVASKVYTYATQAAATSTDASNAAAIADYYAGVSKLADAYIDIFNDKPKDGIGKLLEAQRYMMRISDVYVNRKTGGVFHLTTDKRKLKFASDAINQYFSQAQDNGIKELIKRHSNDINGLLFDLNGILNSSARASDVYLRQIYTISGDKGSVLLPAFYATRPVSLSISGHTVKFHSQDMAKEYSSRLIATPFLRVRSPLNINILKEFLTPAQSSVSPAPMAPILNRDNNLRTLTDDKESAPAPQLQNEDKSLTNPGGGKQ